MSEKGPKFNPATEALNAFEEDKRVHEEQVAREWMRTHWEKAQEILNEGKADRDKVEQFGDEHRQVLEDLVPLSEAQDRLAERTEAEKANPNDDPYEISDVDSEHRRAEEARVIEEAFETKLNAKGNAKLRQMDRLSREYAELEKLIDEGEADEDDLRRHEDVHNRLDELLAKYEASDDYNHEFAYYMIDRSDEARHEAGMSALFEARERGSKKTEEDAIAPTAETDDESTAEQIQGAFDDAFENTRGDEGKDPTDTYDDDNELITPPLEDDDDNELNTPPLDDDEDPSKKKTENDNELVTPPLEDDDETEVLAPVPERRERMSRGRKIAIALGAAAMIGVGAWLATRGLENPFKGMGNWLPDWMRPTEAIEAHAVANPDFIPDVPPQVPAVDTLPASTGFDYPWNWAAEAKGADNAMGFLETLANKAQAAGHAVEWHGNGTTKWIEVDGNSNTQHVIDVLRQYR